MKTHTRFILPTAMDLDDRAELEAAGVVFREPADQWGDQTYVELPDGWHVPMAEPGSFSRNLVDDEGRVRASTKLQSDGTAFLFIRRE